MREIAPSVGPDVSRVYCITRLAPVALYTAPNSPFFSSPPPFQSHQFTMCPSCPALKEDNPSFVLHGIHNTQYDEVSNCRRL